MYIKKCAHCGREFEAGKGNQKYCGIDCRIAAQKILRADWEEKTNYLEKRRHANELKRQRITEEQYQERQKQRKKEQKKRLKQLQQTREREQQELKEQAAAGDPWAILHIIYTDMLKASNTSIEYWQLYKQYQILYAEQFNCISNTIVNEISIFDDNFDQRVIETIQQTGKIIIHSNMIKQNKAEEGGLIPCRTK